MLYRIAQVVLGTPAAKALAHHVGLSVNQSGSLYAHLTQALTRTSEVTGFERPADGVLDNTRALVQNTATTLEAASTEVISVTIYNPLTNTAPFNIGAATVTAARGTQVPVGGSYTTPAGIIDLLLIYIFTTAAGQTAQYTAWTRA